MPAQAAGSVQPEESWTARALEFPRHARQEPEEQAGFFRPTAVHVLGRHETTTPKGGPWMNDRMQGAVAAATLALAVLSAVGLAATVSPAEDHLALAAASATQALLP